MYQMYLWKNTKWQSVVIPAAVIYHRGLFPQCTAYKSPCMLWLAVMFLTLIAGDVTSCQEHPHWYSTSLSPCILKTSGRPNSNKVTEMWCSLVRSLSRQSWSQISARAVFHPEPSLTRINFPPRPALFSFAYIKDIDVQTTHFIWPQRRPC